MSLKKNSAATYGWALLGGYVFVWDLLGYIFGFELLTDGWRRWLMRPRARWVVGLSWILTTKHLFFGHVLPWLDPFHIIGVTFKGVDKIRR